MQNKLTYKGKHEWARITSATRYNYTYNKLPSTLEENDVCSPTKHEVDVTTSKYKLASTIIENKHA